MCVCVRVFKYIYQTSHGTSGNYNYIIVCVILHYKWFTGQEFYCINTFHTLFIDFICFYLCVILAKFVQGIVWP